MESVDDPDKKTFHLTAGDVLLRDEGTFKISTPSKARGELSGNSDVSDSNLFVKPSGFVVAYMPTPFVVPDMQVK